MHAQADYVVLCMMHLHHAPTCTVQVEAELADLDKVHDSLEISSRRVANVFLTGGLFILTSQFLLFIWLTW
jgi:hypothetical protein